MSEPVYYAVALDLVADELMGLEPDDLGVRAPKLVGVIRNASAQLAASEAAVATLRQKCDQDARLLFEMYPLLETLRQALTFDELRAKNKVRCETAFHSIEEWKPWEWSNAMAGECGEACNITKKMARVWPANQFKQNWNKPEDQRMADLEAQLADELADVVIYADLLATRIGRSLGECVRAKFNAKSDEIGSAIKFAALGAVPAPAAPQEPTL